MRLFCFQESEDSKRKRQIMCYKILISAVFQESFWRFLNPCVTLEQVHELKDSKGIPLAPIMKPKDFPLGFKEASDQFVQVLRSLHQSRKEIMKNALVC